LESLIKNPDGKMKNHNWIMQGKACFVNAIITLSAVYGQNGLSFFAMVIHVKFSVINL